MPAWQNINRRGGRDDLDAVPNNLFTNHEAERALLGYLIQHPTAVETIRVEGEHFGDSRHRAAYEAIVKLARTTGAVDTTVLAESLRRSGVESPGSLVGDLESNAGVDVAGLQRILHDCAKRRQLDTLAKTLEAGVWQHLTNIDDLLAAARDQLASLSSAQVDHPFRMLDDEEILCLKADEYLVHGILPARSLAVLLGESSTGKSFLAIDIAFAIASGIPWHGRSVKQGPVVYIAAEGQSGLQRRVRAWKTRHGMLGQRAGVYFIPQAVDPLDDGQITVLLEHLRRLPQAAVLVVIDTWSVCLAAGGGDEDKAKDVNRALTGLRNRVVQELGSSALLVHHEGHVAKGRARGSSALRAGIDTEIALTKSGDVIIVSNIKQRDIAEVDDMAFRLCVQELDDGRSSCVLESAPVPEKTGTAARKGLSEKAWKALAALRSFGDAGTTFNKWSKASGLTGSTFGRAVEKLRGDAYVEKDSADKRALYHVTAKGRDYHHHHQDTSNGGDGGDHDHHHQPPHPLRGGGGGGDGGGLEGRADDLALANDEVEL